MYNKMKLLLISLIWLFSSGFMLIGGGKLGGCYDCSGTASFLWECNSTTVGDTGFSPCGCSDGDTTATPAGGDETITDGVAIFDDSVSANGVDNYTFDVSSDDIWDDTIYTIFIKVKIDTWDNDAPFWEVYEDAENVAKVKIDNADEINLQHMGNNSNLSIVTTDSPLSTGVWYIVRIRNRTADLDPNLTLNVYNTLMVEQGSGISSNTNTVAFAGDDQAGAGDFYVGNRAGQNSYNISIDYIHVYSEWLETDPN